MTTRIGAVSAEADTRAAWPRAATMARLRPVLTRPEFFSAAEIAAMSALAARFPSKPARMVDGMSSSAFIGTETWLRAGTEWIAARLAEIAPDLAMEIPKIVSYPVGGLFAWHTDRGSPTRRIAISLQLSPPDDYTGGELLIMEPETHMADRGLGSLIAFDPLAKHGVAPVTAGERRALVTWLHEER